MLNFGYLVVVFLYILIYPEIMGHLHNGILLVHEKEEHFTLCDSTDGPGEHDAQ